MANRLVRVIFGDNCCSCGGPIQEGAEAIYRDGHIWHEDCETPKPGHTEPRHD